MVIICNDTYPVESDHKYQEYFAWFPYSLSDFQKYSIQATIEGQHSLVTAHTGSGKSLPAEFAIQYFHKKGKKTIYTSPIKALSNQKYYEFTQKYPEISFGLITGDIKLNPTADVLIMTAEILLNSLFVYQTKTDGEHGPIDNTDKIDNLYFQMDFEHELACVVMDEIHYINDRDRGSVWEKTILMLPKHIQMIMLSATIDSPETFAKWCERGQCSNDSTNQQTSKQVWLSSTSHRIVPLTHYGFLITNEGFFKKTKDKALHQEMRNGTQQLLVLKNSDGSFHEDTYLKLTKTKKLLEEYDVFPKRSHVLNQLCVFLKEREMFPAIAFVFSRKNVELFAKEITANLLEDDSKIPYIVSRECEQIVRKLPNFQEYLNLPEYQQLVKLLEKGVGIHHSGMIPILREIVELMISKKYIKVLFATESFAIGLNCPIRSAIFTSLTKFDGNGERILLPHEYNQAASRCGRRGIDTIGHVIHCNNLFSVPSQYEYKNMLCGKPQQLSSKLRISVPFVLNLIKTYGNESSALEFIKNSMVQTEYTDNQTALTLRIATLEHDVEKMIHFLATFLRTPTEKCREYISIQKTVNSLGNKKRKEAERRLQQLLYEHKYIKDDVVHEEKWTKMVIELAQNREELLYTQTYFSRKISDICFILCKHGFLLQKDICSSDPERIEYDLTKKGRIACALAESNPIAMTELLESTEFMRDASAIQIICFLSCFTNVKVSQEVKKSVPDSTDKLLRKLVIVYTNSLDIYQEYVETQQITISNNGSESDLEIIYDLMDIMEEWCQCLDEAQCKAFIQTKLEEKSISIGDFTKAILKISTMTKEWMNVCEQNEGMLGLLSKLGEIDAMILKYITTAQSLYV